MKLVKTGAALLLMVAAAPAFAELKGIPLDSPVPAEATAKMNQQFELKLPSNPTTGYGWIVRQLPEQMALTGMDYAQSPDCKEGMTGCGGITTLHFKAVKTGKGTLIMQYARPWEVLPDETTIPVNIKVTK